MKKGIRLLTYFARICVGFLPLSGGDLWAETGNWLPILPEGTEAVSDASIYKFVSRYFSLEDKEYVPRGLMSISGSSSIDTRGRSIELREEARDSLLSLSQDFTKEFRVPLVVVSGYRSAAYQRRLWDLGRCTDVLCAPPGYSEHQLGLAIDIFEATTEHDILANRAFARYITWMREHAHEYGWTESYQKGEHIDAYEPEPWHWRYVGVSMATRLRKLDLTYTEYIRLSRSLEYLGFSRIQKGYLRFISR